MSTLDTIAGLALLAAWTIAGAAEVGPVIDSVTDLPPAIVALWTIGPGLIAGLSRQLTGIPRPVRQVCGELLASGLSGFVAGAAVMQFLPNHATVWLLLIAGVAAGYAGSETLRFTHRKVKDYTDRRANE